jgi:hypothetical protein
MLGTEQHRHFPNALATLLSQRAVQHAQQLSMGYDAANTTHTEQENCDRIYDEMQPPSSRLTVAVAASSRGAT